MFSWLLALVGVHVVTVPRRDLVALELTALPPGGLVTAWVGGDDD